ncbi:putative extracellular serine/threonine protein kinase FAM20C [Apostichopus japonicus]|uniref:Putative extracellular serine/threonine protein kinase FAM20C n=1 Tax=Stichopus japonicus TaxID=307972 RepID=A0A2G8LBH8_STIJA|nr:putative extracellular serine/threonine protein kinase FAM20C [Apostichopus japonicus]
MFLDVGWCCCANGKLRKRIMVLISGQYLLHINIWHDTCTEEERAERGLNFRNEETMEKIGGSSQQYKVSRSELIPFVFVRNRNKFEALFRDHESSNKLPEDFSSRDELFKSHDANKTYKPWERFHRDINRYQLYSYNNTEMMTSLMTYLNEAPIKICRKLYTTDARRYANKIEYNISRWRPGIDETWRVPREFETLPNHYFFADIERHTSEIAAFHLDRILDFRRVPPTFGRIFNITSEIRPHANGKAFKKSFFKSPANNTCFMTECRQYCELSKTPVCGKPDRVEGSVQSYLPFELEVGHRKTWINPFKRAYRLARGGAIWEDDPSYCHTVVMQKPPFNRGRRLLDIVDLAIFDFLIDNFDRHNYNTLRIFNNFTSTIHYDHGRALRNSTYQRLLLLDKDEYKLGDVMRESLSLDPIAPVLYEPHYDALNRRLGIVIKEVKRCIEYSESESDVLKAEPTLAEYLRSIKPHND